MRLLIVASVVVASLAAVPAVANIPVETVGSVDRGTGLWYLRDAAGGTTSFYFGDPGDVPLVGDWDCDGIDTPGIYRESDGFVYLRNSNSQGVADVSFFLGNLGDIPVAGDFNGDGCDTVSIYRPSQARILVFDELGRNHSGLGSADLDYSFGEPGDAPFIGDFDGDGVDTLGLHRPSTGLVYYRNSHGEGDADAQFHYGLPGDRVVSGRWGLTSVPSGATIGMYRPSSGAFLLRNENTNGNVDVEFDYGNKQMVPVAGYFGNLHGTDDEPPGNHHVDVVAREDWGASPAITSRMTPHTIRRLTVHHSGDPNSTTGPERYRLWQSWHMGDRGWGDLAYHYIIGIDGTVYEGRDTDYAGDTGTGYDTDGHFLVVVEGNFEIEQPTKAQLDSLVAILAWASYEFDVSPSTVTGHRDHAATACPGANLYPYVAGGDLEADIREALAAG
jgi:N-acetylmuramoyl-L-alanine amidase